ncbi:TPA: tyrosine-protein phosphatase [Clostridioides difficile]
MKNFRDLGGNKTEDGRTVKKGLFYRSAKLSNLSENDIKILKELNIKYIFDYRSDEEARKHPSTIISNIKNIRIPAMRELEESGGSFGSIEDMIDGLFEKDGAFNMLNNSYYNLPINNPSYKKLVELIRDYSNLPILNHCTAGKDRTGVGSAIILMILGVSRENIMKDYLKSNDFADKEIERFIEYKPKFKDIPKENLKYIFGVNEEYMKTAFRRIDEEYISVEAYSYGEFNLNKEEIRKLRNQYLE